MDPWPAGSTGRAVVRRLICGGVERLPSLLAGSGLGMVSMGLALGWAWPRESRGAAQSLNQREAALGQFSATVQRTYMIADRRVLVLERGYQGDIDAGDWIEIGGGDASIRAQVVSVAWGSAFHATDPPLTLVVQPDREGIPAEGAAVRSTTGPGDGGGGKDDVGSGSGPPST